MHSIAVGSKLNFRINGLCGNAELEDCLLKYT